MLHLPGIGRKIVIFSITLLICTLSLLDAPEYAHCNHIGVCEFLEVYGIFRPEQQVFEGRKKISSDNKFIISPSFISSPFSAFIDRFIKSHQNQFHILPQKNKTVPNQNIPHYKSFISSQIIQILTTSKMNS